MAGTMKLSDAVSRAQAAEAAMHAAGDAAVNIPPFSAGTAAIPEPGAPTLAPRVGADLLETPPSAEEGAPAAPAQPAQPSGDTPQPAQAAGEAAAEAAATAPPAADPWADPETVEYIDEDSGERYAVRAPKSYAQQVKNGYLRRSEMDRNARYLSRARATLEPLITSGAIDRILPLLNFALTDPSYGQYVADGYLRAVNGQPLMQQAVAEAAAAGIPQQAQPSTQAAPAMEDPWLQEQVEPYLRGQQERIAQLEQTISQLSQTQQQSLAQQQQYTQMQQAANQIAAQTYAELRSLYPAEFVGNMEHDSPLLQQIHAYATNAGYFNTYGYSPAVYRLAYMEMRQGRPQSASPAAANLGQIQERAREQAAAEAARSLGGGTAAGVGVPPPPKDPFGDIKAGIKGKKFRSAQDLARAVAARTNTLNRG